MVLNRNIQNLLIGAFTWDPSLDNLRLGLFAWESLSGICNSRTVVWDLRFGSLRWGYSSLAVRGMGSAIERRAKTAPGRWGRWERMKRVCTCGCVTCYRTHCSFLPFALLSGSTWRFGRWGSGGDSPRPVWLASRRAVPRSVMAWCV